MKRKFAAIILGLTLAAASMGVSATENNSAQNLQQETAAEKTFGTVRKIDGKMISVSLSEPQQIPEEDPEIVAEKKRQENLKNNVNVEDIEDENANADIEVNADSTENMYLDINTNTENVENQNVNIEVDAEDAEHENTDIEVNAEDTEAAKLEEKEIPEKKAQQNLVHDEIDHDVTVIEVADDATIYSVPNTKEGNGLMKECATEDVELPELETLELSAIKEGDDICIWHDEKGKAVLLLVLDPDAEIPAEK